MHPALEPREITGSTADRVIGIIGIVLFACCSIATGFAVVGGGGVPEDFPEELKPESWQMVVSLITYIAMLAGCIGISLSRRWGMLLTGLGGVLLLALTAYALSKYPEQMQAMREYLESAEMSEEERQVLEMSSKMQPFFIAPSVLVTLFYTVYAFLRLGGKVGPAPR